MSTSPAAPHKRPSTASVHVPNTEASTPSAASRVSAVEINPQFVVVRDFAELDAAIYAIKAGPLPPRCTVYDDMGRPVAPFPSLGGERSMGTTTLKRSDVGANSVANSNTPDRNGPTMSNTTAENSADSSNDNSGDRNPAKDDDAATLTSPSAPAPRTHQPGTSPMYPKPHAGSQEQAATSTSASPAQSPNAPRPRSPRPAAARKILCIWDVDDTLVASGAAGVRQNLLFSSTELVQLFKTLPNARHLMLSQGSIDDVFYPNKGRLRFLEKFFTPPGTSESTKGGRGADEATKKSSGSIFSCVGTKERVPVTDEATVFEKGTALIRLTAVRGSPEEQSETDFLYDASAKPKLHGVSTKDQIRWLVLRPTVWGITLGTLNSLFAPSERTAFVDGKIFHKMDVAWSLAKSGHWDTVFFIDNNLSEIGIVKYGMNMNNVLELQHTHHMYKFFHAEFLLLAASAKIRQLEKKHGRSLTVPPPNSAGKFGNESSHHNGSTNTSGAKQDNPLTVDEDEDEALKQKDLPPLALRAMTDDLFVNEALEKERRRPGHLSLSTSARSFDVDQNGAPSSPTDPTFGAGGRCRQVDFVVAHLHLDSERYRQLLLGNRSGTRIGSRNCDVTRTTGQPTFMGDSSLSDEQYEAVLAFFRMEESMMYQLMDEDIRVNGFIDLGDQRKFGPNSRFVHIPVYRRPMTIPHLRRYYEHLCGEVETRVVKPLLSGGGSIRGASVIRGDAHILCTQLLRGGPFLDPLVQGALALELFMVYTAEGNVEKASGEYVHKAVRKLLEDPREAKRKK